MSSISQDSFSPSQPKKVKTVEHEFKQNVLAGIWTKVSNGDRTTRLKNRLKVLAQHEKKYFTLSLSGWNGSVPPSTEQSFLSEIAITQDSDPRSQPNLNVKTVDQEDKQNNVGIWTKVTDNRTTRLPKNRLKVLVKTQPVKKPPHSLPSSPPSGLKGSPPMSPEQSSFLKAKAIAKIAKEEKSQEFVALQAQVVSLSSTLDSLVGMLKSMTGIAPQTQLIPGGSPLPKFEVESPKASFKEA